MTDSKTIVVGSARVIYAKATSQPGREPQPEGWVLPGGERTQSQVRATEVAIELNRLMKEATTVAGSRPHQP